MENSAIRTKERRSPYRDLVVRYSRLSVASAIPFAASAALVGIASARGQVVAAGAGRWLLGAVFGVSGLVLLYGVSQLLIARSQVRHHEAILGAGSQSPESEQE